MTWWKLIAALFTKPAPPPQPRLRTVSIVLQDAEGRRLNGSVVLVAEKNGVVLQRRSGYCVGRISFDEVSDCPARFTVAAEVSGYTVRPHPESYGPEHVMCDDAEVTLVCDPVVVAPVVKQPEDYTDAEVAKIRGSMFTARGPVPFGKRPGSPDNVISFVSVASREYDDATAAMCIRAYQDRKYTHAPVGAFVRGTYHGQMPGASIADFHRDQDLIADRLEQMWAGGIIPVAFLSPDNWTLDQMKDFEPVFRSERWQRLIRIVVPKGYEFSQSDSLQNVCDFFDWAADVFPRALRCLHMVSNCDAPGNDADFERYNPTNPATGQQEGPGWGPIWHRIAPKMHIWLIQNGPIGQGTSFGTYPHEDPENFKNFCDQFRPDVRGSLADRFHNGYAGFPKGSAWGPSTPIKLVAAEFFSHQAWHFNAPEEAAMLWGDGALAAGADGVFDGFHGR